MTTTKVRQLPNGDHVIDVDVALLEAVGLSAGDFIQWDVAEDKSTASFKKFEAERLPIPFGRDAFIVTFPAASCTENFVQFNLLCDVGCGLSRVMALKDFYAFAAGVEAAAEKIQALTISRIDRV